MTWLLVFVIMLLVVFGMSIGVIMGRKRSPVPAAASPTWGSRRNARSAAATGRNARKPTATNL